MYLDFAIKTNSLLRPTRY